MAQLTNIPESINTFNATLKQYGSLEELFHFIDLNEITDIFQVFSAGTSYNIDNFQIIPENPVISGASTSSITNWTIHANQSIFDIGLQFYGNINNVLELIINNPLLLDINNANISGIEIEIINSNTKNINVAAYNKIGWIPTTGLNPIIEPETLGRAFDISWNFSFH